MGKEIVELDANTAGCHIDAVCEEAIAKANALTSPVHFEFNGTDVTVQPGETVKEVVARWDADTTKAREAWLASPEYREREEKREREAAEARAAHMTETAHTEQEMRDAKVPWPLTKEQLAEYIDSLVNRSHDYGTCVYAMSMAATAAFYYAAGILGSTGFQSGCADLDIIRRTRCIDGPFMLIKAHDALYPQYDLRQKLEEAMAKWQPWLAEQAQKMLAEQTYPVHPNVERHWKRLAAARKEKD